MAQEGSATLALHGDRLSPVRGTRDFLENQLGRIDGREQRGPCDCGGVPWRSSLEIKTFHLEEGELVKTQDIPKGSPQPS